MTDFVNWVLTFALQLALVGLEVNEGQLAPNQGDHLWLRVKGTSTCWYVIPSKYADGPKLAKWQGAYDAIYATQQYHIAQGNVKGPDISNKPLCDAGTGVDTSMLYPVAVAPAPPVVVVTTINAPAGSMTTTEGIWTFGAATSPSGNAILLNGKQAGGGFGVKLNLIAAKVYAVNATGQWYYWTGSWVPVPAQ